MTTTIRALAARDLPEAARLGRQFFTEGQCAGRFSEDSFVDIWTKLLGSGLGYIAGAYNGDGRLVAAIGALRSPDPNTGEQVAQEAFWYSHPSKRGMMTSFRLLKEYDAWCRDKGVRRQRLACLIALQPTKLHRFYQRIGYRPIEIHYEREVA